MPATAEALRPVPHRLKAATRRDWFFRPKPYGGFLNDIASHQIEPFVHITGSDDAETAFAPVGNFANPDMPAFEGFGEVALRSQHAQGYFRVDWYTVDALPNRSDGRLFVTGSESMIELRKYVDVAGRPGTDHLFRVSAKHCEHIDCAAAPLPCFGSLLADIRDRTDTACSQTRTFRVRERTIKAQIASQLHAVQHVSAGREFQRRPLEHHLLTIA